MRKIICSAAAAVALALSSTANAAILVTVPAPPIYTPPTSGLIGGQVAPNSTTTDSFVFNIIGSPAFFSGQLSTIALAPGGPGNINFSDILIDGVGGMFSLVTGPGAPEMWACCQPAGNGFIQLGVGQHTLTFTAQNTSGVLGSYVGTFNFAPVPEPATWAMMLLGFGAMGFSLRRRREPVFAQIA